MANAKKSTSVVKKTALSGVMAAIAMVILLLAEESVFDLTLLVVCSLVTTFIAVECGMRYGWLYAAVTTTLAFLLLPSKLYAMEYAMFAAVYPLVKPLLERFGRKKRVGFLLKLLVLEAMLFSCVVVGQFVLGVGDAFFALGWATMLGGAAFFAVYDYALTQCLRFYFVKLRKRLGISKFLL